MTRLIGSLLLLAALSAGCAQKPAQPEWDGGVSKPQSYPSTSGWVPTQRQYPTDDGMARKDAEMRSRPKTKFGP